MVLFFFCRFFVITQEAAWRGAAPSKTVLFAPLGRLRRPSEAKKGIRGGRRAPHPQQAYPLGNDV
jgi:hypothetical protein